MFISQPAVFAGPARASCGRWGYPASFSLSAPLIVVPACGSLLRTLSRPDPLSPQAFELLIAAEPIPIKMIVRQRERDPLYRFHKFHVEIPNVRQSSLLWSRVRSPSGAVVAARGNRQCFKGGPDQKHVAVAQLFFCGGKRALSLGECLVH